MFFKKNVRVAIRNLNLVIEVKSGTNLYQALFTEGVIPATLCRGNGQCGKCKVHITQKNISKPNKKEQLVLARINLDAGFRLACQTIIKEDMSVDTSEIVTAMSEDYLTRPNVRQNASIQINNNKPATPEIPKDKPAAQAEEPAAQAAAPTPPPTPTPPAPEKSKPVHHAPSSQPTDGLLLVQNKNQLRYFLYSAAIDGIAQEGTVENASELTPYISSGMLSDYVHDQLKIKDIDRIIILSDDPSEEGEHLFDIVSYYPFDIGSMPCELIRPLPQAGDLSLFLRLLSVKGKKRLIVSLDKLNNTFYIAENKIYHIPNNLPSTPVNLLDALPKGDNPIVSINDDLRTILANKPYNAPNALSLPLFMKVAAQMVKRRLADNEFRIYPRNRLDSSVPLEYVIKITQQGESNAYYLYRDKQESMMVTQDMLTQLLQAKKFIHYAIEYTESNLGNIEAVILSTPTPQANLLDHATDVSLVPKRHENIMIQSSGDSSVIAVKLFQEPDVRTYISKNYGLFIKSSEN